MQPQVRVKLKSDESDSPKIGWVPIRALARWEAKGYVAIDEDEVAAARAAVATDAPAEASEPVDVAETPTPTPDEDPAAGQPPVDVQPQGDPTTSDPATTGQGGTAAGSADDQNSGTDTPGRAGRGR